MCTVLYIVQKKNMASKGSSDEASIFHETVDCVVSLHVNNSRDTIIKKLDVQSTEIKTISTDINTMTDTLVDSQNGVIETVNTVSAQVTADTNATAVMRDEISEEIRTVVHHIQKSNDRADKNERISHQVRGQLGAQERKRRKVDLDEISRLRNEVGILKRQARDKDKTIESMGAQIAQTRSEVERFRDSVFQQMQASYRESAEFRESVLNRFDTLTDLMQVLIRSNSR